MQLRLIPNVVIMSSLVLAMVGCASMASAQPNYDEDAVEITFSSLEVDDSFGRLEVDYLLESRDWRWAQNNDFDLWLGLYVPAGDEWEFARGEKLLSRRRTVVFPANVAYQRYPYVGLCVIAVGVGDTLEPGYGYVCDSPVRVNVGRSQDVYWSQSNVIFSLGFHRTLYGYPWWRAGYGFQYPYYYFAPPRVLVVPRHPKFRRHHKFRHHRGDRHFRHHRGDRHFRRHRGDRHFRRHRGDRKFHRHRARPHQRRHIQQRRHRRGRHIQQRRQRPQQRMRQAPRQQRRQFRQPQQRRPNQQRHHFRRPQQKR